MITPSFQTHSNICLTATLDAKEAYSDADFVVIAAPTRHIPLVCTLKLKTSTR